MNAPVFGAPVRPGFVYLVGAGPGDPGLLTLRAAEILASADLVLFDRLVNPAILAHASRARLCAVGKQGGKPCRNRQHRIQQMMIAAARRGLVVVRLKGGDPFVFGRGGEEALALVHARVPVAVVPGVSSFYAVPAAAGIPVTHRGLSTAFAVFTGHEAEFGSSGIPWDLAARIPTAIFLMGVRRLPQIVEELVRHGRDPATPVAVIARGTRHDQEERKGSLADIAARVSGLQAPATIVVGEVVRLGTVLHAAQNLPAIAGTVRVQD